MNRNAEEAAELTKWIFEYLGSLHMTPLYEEMNKGDRPEIRNWVYSKIVDTLNKTGREGK